MTYLSIHQARSRLSEILGEVTLSHVPVTIGDERHSGVLVSAEDWQAMQETLYLLSIPGMRESIREGMQTPVEECSKTLWPEDEP
jgi:prevent-host-death family protein